MRRRAHRRTQQGVELNLAAMLDMAFQLLAFFILTFRPSPVEAELAMYLPPATAMTKVRPPEAAAAAPGGVTIDPALDTTVVLIVSSNENGDLTGVSEGFGAVIFKGSANASNLFQLEMRLRELFGFEGSPFTQAQIEADPRLRYEELMRIVDVCLRQKLANGESLQNIGFVESQSTEAGR